MYRQQRLFNQIAKKQSVQAELIALLRTFQERQWQLWMLVSMLMAVIFVNELHPGEPATPPALPLASEADQPQSAAPPAKAANNPFEKALSQNRTNSALPFSDITEFNEQNSAQKAYVDLLKRRYEAWLVSYYYLQKCGKADASDGADIRASLHRELTAAQAGAADEDNILLAANGSYTEMYRDIPCDASHIGPTKAAYDAKKKEMTPNATAPTSPRAAR